MNLLLSVLIIFFVGDACADDLLGLFMNSCEEDCVLYNEHAFRVDFSIRKSKQRYKGGIKILLMKRFYCSKAGKKEKIAKENKCYSKLDV